MCPSAPRVCSEPGGQKPVLSLSLDLIVYTVCFLFCFVVVRQYRPLSPYPSWCILDSNSVPQPWWTKPLVCRMIPQDISNQLGLMTHILLFKTVVNSLFYVFFSHGRSGKYYQAKIQCPLIIQILSKLLIFKAILKKQQRSNSFPVCMHGLGIKEH